MKNVIILGAGRTGSSFLSGLISHNRFYINKESIPVRETYPDGDYENPDLIALNVKLLKASGYPFPKATSGHPVNLDNINNLRQTIDLSEYKEFIAKCEGNGPWLWKDPRLCYTIHFWKDLLNFENINVIKITRDPYLVFRSHSKFQIKDSKANITKSYYAQTNSVDKFIKTKDISSLLVCYPELKQTSIIEKLNQFLCTDITVKDYKFIKKDNISKKESDFHFLIRYYLGLIKLQLKKRILNL